MQVRAEANLIWLCREQPTINRINPPELNIRIYSIRLNTDVRQLLTYSPKGYTAVTVGVSPTACNKSNHEHPKWCYIRANNGAPPNLPRGEAYVSIFLSEARKAGLRN